MRQEDNGLRALTNEELEDVSGGLCATTEFTIAFNDGSKLVLGFDSCGDVTLPRGSFTPAPTKGAKGGKA